MWGDIVLTISTSICEAICTNLLSKKETEEYQRKLTDILQELLVDFADSSLDCYEFHTFVNSSSFVQHVRLFYHTIYSEKTAMEPYRNNLVRYICGNFSNLYYNDVLEFVGKLCDLYENHLFKTIKETPVIDALFQLLVKTNREAINKVIHNQDLILSFLKSQDANDVVIENEDIKIYHETCEKEYGVIRFTGISGVENRKAQNINDFYIANTFSFCPSNIQNQYSREIDDLLALELSEMFAFSNKIVLLGGAGLGKTTTLNYLYCNYETLFQTCNLKIKIDLKEYAKDIWENKKDILWCIATDFYKKTKRKKTSFENIEAMLAEFLGKGHCLIIFDALDEITSQPVRNKVRDEIANFSEIYYLNRFIITSREAGYLRNRFDDSFLHIRINEFEEKQIEQYARNWINVNGVEVDFSEFWDKFQNEVNRAQCDRLIKNPIILILALVIFDIEKNLPNKRVEFYKKCIDTFLSVREDRKAAHDLSEKAKNILGIDLVVPQIAHYKFERINEDMGYRFTEDELENAVYDAIEVPDPINWASAVEDYSKYLVERTELIREVDEDILDFAHKTFFEYFLAVYYVKEYDYDELVEQLKKWIGDSNYDELARLIIEVIIQNNNSRQHQRVIEFLLVTVEKRPSEYPGYFVNSVFSIIADLYRHNMLLPKFHSRYFQCILYRPKFVKIPMLLRRRAKHNDKIEYDSIILAQMYCKAVNEEGKYEETLDALYYLDNEFRNHTVIGIAKDTHVHVVNLLRGVQRYDEISREAVRELEFFISDPRGIELALNYPQIFLSVLFIMAQQKNFDRVEYLATAQFKSNRLFMEYTMPRTLQELFSLATQSSAGLVVLLIALIRCGFKETNYLFNFVLDSNYSGIIDISKENSMIAYWLWSALYETKSYSEFKAVLSERDLYDSAYDKEIKDLYDEYVQREKECGTEQIEKSIKELRTRDGLELIKIPQLL